MMVQWDCYQREGERGREREREGGGGGGRERESLLYSVVTKV